MNKFVRILNFKPDRQLSWFLWLVMLHSIGVGMGLIFAPSFILEYFNFSFHPTRFFVTQGGVFHIVMSVCYGMAARDPLRHESLVILAIVTKFIATVFLAIYFLLIDSVLVILLSGIGDFIMGAGLYYLFRTRNTK